MFDYINALGKLVPQALELASKEEQVGCHLYLRVYGYYSLKGGLRRKYRQYRNNGGK